MKNFIFNTLAFFIPIILLILLIEIYLANYSSTFQQKSNYFNENKNEIELLILGSSHNQTALNPAHISKKKAANLAFGGQGLELDYLLLKKNILETQKLNIIVLELSYHSLEHSNPPNYHRNNLYKRFYNINNFNRPTTLMDNSIFFSNPLLYLGYLNPFVEKEIMNKYGFVTKNNSKDDNSNRFKNLNYNTKIIDNDSNNIFITRSKTEDLKAYNHNIKIFSKMVDLSYEYKKEIIIISPPVYNSYYKNMLKSKINRRKKFIENLQKKHPKIIFLNFENEESFNVFDFKNEDHLNPKGAEKFTKMFNDNFL